MRRKPRPQKAQHRLLVTFENEQDCDAVICAMLGQGYGVSMEESALSFGQVAYRMKLAREAYRMPKGVGFAREYHQGLSPLAKQVRAEVMPAIRANVMLRLAKARKHPTPKTVNRG